MRPSWRSLRLTESLLLAIVLLPAGGFAFAQQSAALDQALDQAQAAQNSENYAEAATAYARATRLAPRIPELWANRGLMEHLASQPAAAITSFHQALALKPGLFTPTLFTGLDYVALGKPEQALPFLRKALAEQPQNPEATLALAKTLAELHQLRSSVDAYQAAADANPNSSVAWYGLAVSSLNLIESDGAQLALGHGDSVWARMLYADELLAQARTREATHLYEETARAATPAQRSIFLRLLDARESTAATQPDPSHELSPETVETLRQALQPASGSNLCAGSAESPAGTACAFLSGDFPRSAELASAALKRNSSDVEALYWSIKSNERRAVLAFSRFQSLAPQSPATFDLAGDLYRRRDLPGEARSEYAKALAADPYDPAALLGTAAAHLSEGHADDAFSVARIGLADRPSDPRLNLIAGEALVANHHFADARPYLDRSIGNDAATDVHVHALLGRVAAEAGRTDEAIREMRLGLPSDRDGSLHFQLYRLLRQTGDLAGAQQAEAGARALQARRLQHATTAVDEMQSPSHN